MKPKYKIGMLVGFGPDPKDVNRDMQYMEIRGIIQSENGFAYTNNVEGVGAHIEVKEIDVISAYRQIGSKSKVKKPRKAKVSEAKDDAHPH